MRKIIIIIGIMIGVLGMLVVVKAQNSSSMKSMKLNTGIVTSKINESKKFYNEVFNFGVTFQNEFYLLMHTPNHQTELAFLLPDHPTQRSIFKTAFTGKGVFITLEVPDVDSAYKRIRSLGIPIEIELRDEPGVIGILPL